MVTHDDVIEYVREVQKGKTEYYNILMKKCGQIVTTTVKKYLAILRKYNIEVDDFKQHLYLCFFESLNKYPKDHKNFIAYEFTYINQSALQFLHNYNKIADDEKPVSLDVYVNGGEKKDITLLDIIADEQAKQDFRNIEYKIMRENSARNIRKVLRKFISDEDIDFLYDVYGFNGIKTVVEIAKEYNLTLHEVIMWERLTILTLQTNAKIYDYYEQLMCNIETSYSYSFSRFKYTNTSSTEYIAIKNIYIEKKIEELKERVKISMPTLHKNIAKATPETFKLTPNWNKKKS